MSSRFIQPVGWDPELRGRGARPRANLEAPGEPRGHAPLSLIILQRSNDNAGCGHDSKLKRLILGEIHAGGDIRHRIYEIGYLALNRRTIGIDQ
jgi:hypothetical protein